MTSRLAILALDLVALVLVGTCLLALTALPAHACPSIASRLPALSSPLVARSVVSIDRAGVVVRSADGKSWALFSHGSDCSKVRRRMFGSKKAAMGALRGAA